MTRIPFAKQDFAHWAVTERAQASADAYTVQLRVEDRTLVVNGEPIRFGNQEFALHAAMTTCADHAVLALGRGE